MISWWKLVRHADVPAHEALGWRVAFELGPVHGAWSIGMFWTGEGEPP